MLIDKKVVDSCNNTLDFKVEEIRPWTYYWIEIKLTGANCVHNSVMATKGHRDYHSGLWTVSKEVMLFNTGYEPEVLTRNIDEIFWFKIVKTIHTPQHVIEDYNKLRRNNK